MFKMQKIILIFLFQFLSVSCAEVNKDPISITFPLLNECEESARVFLSSLEKHPDMKYKVIEFDKVLDSHPSIVGYIEIYSDIDSKEGLISMANRISHDCYPETSEVIHLDSSPGDYLNKILYLNKRMGIEKTYLVIESGKIKAYYHDNKEALIESGKVEFLEKRKDKTTYRVLPE